MNDIQEYAVSVMRKKRLEKGISLQTIEIAAMAISK
ncbi:hypothetical protein EZS27_044266 [termite gut metagenome]|uniref:Uncharacterized protein n=1 Tax=termite gut metagenome TaxID=433724 RepID=A0A5J4P5Z4_9ZZZZ